jgi:putative DNA primase/helicase
MQEERNGIFNWMVQGLRRLMENDAFTESGCIISSANQYRQDNDVVASFVGNMCCNEDTPVSINTMYRIYTVWTDKEGTRAVSKKTFINRITDLGYERKVISTNKGSTMSCFAGLSIDKFGEDYKENALEYTLAIQSL